MEISDWVIVCVAIGSDDSSHIYATASKVGEDRCNCVTVSDYTLTNHLSIVELNNLLCHIDTPFTECESGDFPDHNDSLLAGCTRFTVTNIANNSPGVVVG